MIELLFLITNENNDKKLRKIEQKYQLPFNLATHGKGTASSSLLNYFGLEEIKKYIYFSIINYYEKDSILIDLKKELKLEKPGFGIAFTIPISSSTRYIKDKIYHKNKEVIMKKLDETNKLKYELIIAVVNEGYNDKVMNVAKKRGANGGTLIKGRSLLENSSKNQFLGITIEPEKDIVIIVVNEENKKEIMTSLTEEIGLKTKGNGIVFSLPIDTAIGLHE